MLLQTDAGEMEYDDLVKQRASAPDLWNLGGLGISGEAGEAMELLLSGADMMVRAAKVSDDIKKFSFHGKTLQSEKLALELGDVLWYVTYLAHCLGMSLEDIALMNANKLIARYPEGFRMGGGVREGKGA